MNHNSQKLGEELASPFHRIFAYLFPKSASDKTLSSYQRGLTSALLLKHDLLGATASWKKFIFRPQDIQCPAQTEIPAEASAAVPRCSVEPAMSSWRAPRSPVPKELFLSQMESPSDPRPVHSPLSIPLRQSNSLDCKLCRELNVLCDHALPQCSHCYEQQTLCFYVGPKQMSKSKAEIWRWLEMSSHESDLDG